MTDRLSPEAVEYRSGDVLMGDGLQRSRPDRIIRDLETWVREPYKGGAPLHKVTAKRLLTYIESLERLRANEKRLRAALKQG